MSIPVKTPGGRAGAGQSKPQKLWPTVKRLSGYMEKSKWLLLLTLFAAAGGTVMEVLGPKILGNATTLIADGLVLGSIDFAALLDILMLTGGLYLGVFAADFLQQRIMVVVSQKTVCSIRRELREKLNRVPVSFFDKNSNGNLMSIAVNDMENIVTTLEQSLTNLISSAVLVVGILWMMLTISPLLTLMACLMIPGSTLIVRYFTPRTQKNNKNYMKTQGDLNGQIEETYQGFAVVKSFGGEAAMKEQFRKMNDEMYESGWRAKFFGGSMMPGMSLLQNAVYIIITAIGAVSVAGGGIRIGDMQAFLQYSMQFSGPFSRFSQIWNNILSMVASTERVFEILDAEEMTELPAVFPVIPEEKAQITFDHVQFGYTEKPLMEDFSMAVEAGQMVAVVGHTGAGKSTLINLLERFYDIRDGSIRIEGSDIRNMSREALRSRIGMVLQDTWLFSGTIYDNICYGNKNATEDQVIAAAKAAFADDFIRKLPEGYQTVLDEDAGNISQGQRQLITIARAFVSDPDILVLDEATSNVDSRTEIIIQKAMRRLLKGRTSFVVAHRLSTIYDADQIIVMADGSIAETGTHRELLEKESVYAEIYNSQFAPGAA